MPKENTLKSVAGSAPLTIPELEQSKAAVLNTLCLAVLLSKQRSGTSDASRRFKLR
jgi:hypothetical protein